MPATELPSGAYRLEDAAALLGLTVAQIRGYVRAGLLEPERGPRGELRLSFPDLLFLRKVKELAEGRVPPRRIRRALTRLRKQLPDGRSLGGVDLAAEGRRVVAREGSSSWNPETGQCLLEFQARGEEASLARLGHLRPDSAPDVTLIEDAEGWYMLGCELEETQPDRAREAYRRALEIDANHAAAHLNLGCLCHGEGELGEAETHYRAALAARPDDPTAVFNLGVAFEDQDRTAEARRAYETALAADPAFADAHYNLARIHDRLGELAAAIRHLKAYRKLTQGQ